MQAVFDMPEAEYHAVPALGSTSLRNLLRSPAHYLAGLHDTKETAAMRLGHLVHECILQPERWRARKVEPAYDRRTKAGKAAWAEWQKNVAGQRTMTDSEARQVSQIVARLGENRLAMGMLAKCDKREVSLFWEESGVPCKARLDAYGPGLVWDLKTTEDASPEGFSKSVARFAYHLQASHYSRGVELWQGALPDYAMVAVEKSDPWASSVYVLDEQAAEAADAMRNRALGVYRKCQESGRWPAYGDDVKVLSLPRWAL